MVDNTSTHQFVSFLFLRMVKAPIFGMFQNTEVLGI